MPNLSVLVYLFIRIFLIIKTTKAVQGIIVQFANRIFYSLYS